MIEIKESERLDDLGRKGYKIIQDPEKFCFGIDAVLLSSFAKVKKGEYVLDLGTGTGIIPILLEAKTEGEQFQALEIQEESVEMARRSVAYNHLEAKIDIVCGDIKEAGRIFGPASFHVVTTNPPYMTDLHGIRNPQEPKAIARHELLCSFEDIARETSKVLKVKGRMYLVHRPHRIAELIDVLRKYHLEPKRIQFVHSFIDKEASMVLIEAVKCGKTFAKVEHPLIIYERPGIYTKEVLQMYQE